MASSRRMSSCWPSLIENSRWANGLFPSSGAMVRRVSPWWTSGTIRIETGLRPGVARGDDQSALGVLVVPAVNLPLVVEQEREADSVLAPTTIGLRSPSGRRYAPTASPSGEGWP